MVQSFIANTYPCGSNEHANQQGELGEVFGGFESDHICGPP